MTPAAQTVFIRLTDGAPRAAATGTAPPSVRLLLRTEGRLNFAFLNDDGEIAELEDGTTGRLVIKEEAGADDEALFRDTSIEEDGTGDDLRYFFTGLLDSDDLRAALAGLREKKFIAQLEWTQPSDDFRSACEPFEITIVQSYHRDDDAAPIITAATELILNAEEDALEVKINGVSKGFLLLVTDPHP